MQAFIGEESVSHTFLLKGKPSAAVLSFSQHLSHTTATQHPMVYKHSQVLYYNQGIHNP